MGPEKHSPLRKTWRIVVQTSNIYIEIDGEQRAAAFAYYVPVSYTHLTLPTILLV